MNLEQVQLKSRKTQKGVMSNLKRAPTPNCPFYVLGILKHLKTEFGKNKVIKVTSFSQ